MPLRRRAKEILAAIRLLPVVDSHEHLVPEHERLSMDVDIFTLFSQYSKWDLIRAGMSPEQNLKLFDTSIDLDERWRIFRPHWEAIRFGSFARASILSVRRLFEIDDIDDGTYRMISESMAGNNTPGLYRRVLTDAANITVVLDQCQHTSIEPSFLKPIMYAPLVIEEDPFTWKTLHRPYFLPGGTIDTYDEYLAEVDAYLDRMHDEGSLAFKISSYRYRGANDTDARDVFNGLKNGTIKSIKRENALTDRVLDLVIAVARRHDLPVAVHCGYWNDFRETDPLHMIPVLQANPDVRFDLYHLGVPWSRETLFIAKNFANVWINFCWAHAISQRVAYQAMDEALDLIPTNKVLAFGGDYLYSVENVCGHLEMAQLNMAMVLGDRVESGEMTYGQASRTAERWLSGNASALYQLYDRR